MIDDSKTAILLLQALGSPSAKKQESLVHYYERLGFSTCVRVENDSNIFSNGAVCMYAPMSTLFQECKGRFGGRFGTTEGTQNPKADPFDQFRSL